MSLTTHETEMEDCVCGVVVIVVVVVVVKEMLTSENSEVFEALREGEQLDRRLSDDQMMLSIICQQDVSIIW